MLSHGQIWAAIDKLAERKKLTASGLARRAGLDPTTFNKSKRLAGDGRPRWPSTESIAKVLEATGAGLTDFFGKPAGGLGGDALPVPRAVPLLGFAQAGAGGFFDDGGFPVGTGWDEISFPERRDEPVYALEISGDSMLPLYRHGDVLIVSRASSVRRGDRVVVKTTDGEVMAKILHRRTARQIELTSLNPDHPDRTVPLAEIEWMARILWASQ